MSFYHFSYAFTMHLLTDTVHDGKWRAMSWLYCIIGLPTLFAPLYLNIGRMLTAAARGSGEFIQQKAVHSSILFLSFF